MKRIDWNSQILTPRLVLTTKESRKKSTIEKVNL